jgi:hypothetical protein
LLLLSLAAACEASEPDKLCDADNAADGGRSTPDEASCMPDDSHEVADSTSGYRLSLVKRYGVPLSNATGVACDGDSVWLVGGGHNSDSHSVVHANLASSDFDKTFEFDNLIESLGTGVYGITNLNGEIFLAVAGNTNKLVVIDPANGKIRRSFQAPSRLGPADLDFTEDGQLVESTGTGDVYTLDPKTGAVRSSFWVGDDYRDNGVAVRRKQVFVGRLFGGMQVFNLSDGKLLGDVTHLDGSELDQTRDLGSMCFRGDHLLILSTEGLSEYELKDPG